jgi:hypothetical protein
MARWVGADGVAGGVTGSWLVVSEADKEGVGTIFVCALSDF